MAAAILQECRTKRAQNPHELAMTKVSYAYIVTCATVELRRYKVGRTCHTPGMSKWHVMRHPDDKGAR